MLSGKRDVNKLKESGREHNAVTTAYGSRYFKRGIPKFEMPREGMPAQAAYRLICDELN